MGKKGKQKARVEEEEEEDGLNGIGSLWGEDAGEEEEEAWGQSRGNTYDPWGASQVEAASNRDVPSGWGMSVGAGGGGKGKASGGGIPSNAGWGTKTQPSQMHAYQQSQMNAYQQSQMHAQQQKSHGQGRGKQGDKGGKKEDGWGANSNNGWAAAAAAEDSGWGTEAAGGWGTEQGGDWGQAAPQSWEEDWTGRGNSKPPKVTVTSPSAAGSRRVLSPQEHHQLLNSLLNQPNKSGQGHGRNQPAEQEQKGGGKKGKKNKKQQHQQSLWPTQEVAEEYAQVDEGGGYDAWATNIGTNWGGPTYSLPSKTFALAADGRSPAIRKGAEGNPYMETRFIESNGAALIPAQKALYSKDRLARNRIHWLFSPQKDERVASLLDWIQMMSYGLASLGLDRFLQTRERGALFSNAEYRPWESETEPAFDWVTYDRVQATQDRTLQESLAFYDPSTQILVFVFLLSKTGNSMAMWRRKLVIPNNLRLTYAREISQAKAGLRKEYPIHIDEVPVKAAPASQGDAKLQPKRLTKRKWLRFLK